jgi:hypothetical protein
MAKHRFSTHNQPKRTERDTHLLSQNIIDNPPSGRHNDGGGLTLRNADEKGCSWEFLYAGTKIGENGHERVTIGPRSKVSASEARDRAALFRRLLRDGKSPKKYVEQERLERKKKVEAAETFGDAIIEYYNHGKGRLWIVKSGHCSMDYAYRKCLKLDKELLARPLPSITATDLAEYVYPQKLWDKHPSIVRRIASFLIGLFSRANVRLRPDGSRFHPGPNPSKFGKHSDLVRIRGALPQGGNYRDLPHEDLPLLTYHLMLPEHERRPGFASVAELAFACECDPYKFTKLANNGELPGAYKERNHPTAPWFIPITEAEKKGFKLKRPLPSYSQTDIDLYYAMIQFQMLSLVRPDQVCQLRFRNVDEKKNLVTYRAATNTTPGEHKMGHHKPRNYVSILTPRMAEIINWARQRRLRDGLTCNPDDYVFVHERTRRGRDIHWGRPTQPGALVYNLHALLKRIPEITIKNASVHAMRDAFPTWAALNNYGHDLINLTLGKPLIAVAENKANDPYWKAVMVALQKKQREMMLEWERYLLSMWKENEMRRQEEMRRRQQTATVVPLRPQSSSA